MKTASRRRMHDTVRSVAGVEQAPFRWSDFARGVAYSAAVVLVLWALTVAVMVAA